MKEWELRPARDFGLPFSERLKSHRREPGLVATASHAAWLAAVRAYLRLFHRLDITGRENIPANAPFVMIGNHTSHLDALSLSAALPRRLGVNAAALAAGNVFFGNVAAAMFAATALNALPIWREETTPEDLAFLRQRLADDGMIFILFPEGTRARDGVMKRFRAGIGAFVAGTEIPVVPCHLTGAFACWPAQRALPRPGKLSLRIGPPLTFADAANDVRGWRDVSQRAEQAVRALAP